MIEFASIQPDQQLDSSFCPRESPHYSPLTGFCWSTSCVVTFIVAAS